MARRPPLARQAEPYSGSGIPPTNNPSRQLPIDDQVESIEGRVNLYDGCST